MKILFTKIGIENEVSKKMGTDFVFDFQDFIKIEHLKTKPFDLKNYSLVFSSVNAVKSFFNNKFEPHENFLNPKKFKKELESVLVDEIHAYCLTDRGSAGMYPIERALKYLGIRSAYCRGK